MATDLNNTEYLTDLEIEEVMREVIRRFLLPKFIELGMPATHEWERNVEARSNSIWGREYTEQLVYGRKPGSYAPIAPLEKWAQVKLGLSGREALSAAFAISRKLYNEGSSWYQKGGTDLLEILQSPEVVNFVSERFQTIINNQIITRFKNEVKKAFA